MVLNPLGQTICRNCAQGVGVTWGYRARALVKRNRALQEAAMNLGRLPVPSVHRLLLFRVSEWFPKLLPHAGCSP